MTQATYAVEVRDHVMIAHSLPRPIFGPAQALHGATYVIDVAFLRPDLTEDGVVVDIGRATDTLKAILKPLAYANLDDLPAFKGVVTTTEVLCRHIFDAMAAALAEGAVGPGSEGVTALRVTLTESHIAKAWFEGPVGPAAA